MSTQTIRHLPAPAQARLLDLLAALINQHDADILVPPYAAESGYWFGGGNVVKTADGALWLCGRYRNAGDSRTGLQAGPRGLECAVFRADGPGEPFSQVHIWSKADLSVHGDRVVSIEGTALHRQPDGTWELFISMEKEAAYPSPWEEYQKPGTGVWMIDRITGPTPAGLDVATQQPVLDGFSHPEYLHVKDPVVFDRANGTTALIFCTHPFTWASSNSGLALRPAGSDRFTVETWEMASRGAAWDVAATRITTRMTVPRIGIFADLPPASVYFYDGAECLRDHEENVRARKRPRGFSCEEIGGAFFGWDDEFPTVSRLSPFQPLFISPWGTGVSRYVDVLATDDGLLATWQQGQSDGSQPLVGHWLKQADIVELLGA